MQALRVAPTTVAAVKVSNASKRVMMKPGIHPEFHEEADVFCNGEKVMSIGGTKSEYYVDLWSGNHPFYQGVTTAVVVDEGAVNKFKKRYAGLDSLSAVETMNTQKDKKN